MASARTAASESTQHIAEVTHTTLSNALTTPSVAAIHGDHAPVSVVISDPVSFAAKRAQMIAAGPTHLQVIVDFDRTLSAFRTSNGSLCAASHELLENCVGFERTSFKPEMDAINSKYFALEVDPHLSPEKRAEFMLEWWNQAHDLLLKQGIKHQAIEDAVARARKEGNLELRKGAKEFVHLLAQADVPLLVFSAGLAATIESTLRQENLLLLHMHLIGNTMHFSPEDGSLLRFGEDVITSSNKNYSHVRSMEPAFVERSAQRRTVLLAGDNLGDAQMATGLEGISTILRVGLLHERADERLEAFKQAFDVVLLNDADCSFMHQLVQDIIDGKPMQGNGTIAASASSSAASAQ